MRPLLDDPGEVDPKRRLVPVYRDGLASMKKHGTNLRQGRQFSQLLYRTDLKKSLVSGITYANTLEF